MNKGPHLVKSNLTQRQLKRQREFKDLQKDLTIHMGKLMGAHIYQQGCPDEPVEGSVDVADMFSTVLESKFGDETHIWLTDMLGVKVQSLRRIADEAEHYGLAELAGIVRKHMAMRKKAA